MFQLFFQTEIENLFLENKIDSRIRAKIYEIDFKQAFFDAALIIIITKQLMIVFGGDFKILNI